MKPVRKVNLKFFISIFLMVAFCVAGLGFVVSSKNSAVAEVINNVEQTLEQNVSEQNQNTLSEALENAQGNWADFAIAPGSIGDSAENLGSVDTTNKKIIISGSDAAQELAWVAANIATYYNYTVELQSDVDLGGKFWTAIGTSSRSFTGTFIGNGHIITGLMFEPSATYKALFGNCSGAKIYDVIVKNCVNASYALSASSSVTIINACSYGVSLSNGGTIYHSISNGTLSSSQTSGLSGVGLNKFSYFVNYDYTDGTTDVAGTEQTATGSFKIADGVSTSQTIEKIEMQFYTQGSTGITLSSTKYTYTMNNEGKSLSYGTSNQISVTLTAGADVRGSSGWSGTNKNVLPTGLSISYAHQAAVRITVTVGKRLVKVSSATASMLNTSSQAYSYTEVKGYYDDPDNTPSSATLSTISDWTGVTTGSYSGSGIVNQYIATGTTLTVSENYARVGGIAVTTGTNFGAWATSPTVTISTSAGDTTKATTSLTYRLKNVNAITVNNSSLAQDSTTKKLTVSGSTTAYAVVTITGNYGGNLFFDTSVMKELSEYTAKGVGALHVTQTDPKSSSMNNTNIYQSASAVTSVNGAIPGNKSSYSQKMALNANWGGANGAAGPTQLYFAWVLGTSSIRLNGSNGDYLDICRQLYNPYLANSQLSDGLTFNSVINYPSTYQITFYNRAENTAKDVLQRKILCVSGTKANSNVTLYKDTFWKEGDVLSSGSTETVTIGSNAHAQAWKVYLLGANTYTFELRDKTIRVRFMAQNQNNNAFGELTGIKVTTESAGEKTFAKSTTVSSQPYYWLENTSTAGIDFLYYLSDTFNVAFQINTANSLFKLNGVSLYSGSYAGKTYSTYNLATTSTAFSHATNSVNFKFDYSNISYALEGGISPVILVKLTFQVYENTYNLNFSDNEMSNFHSIAGTKITSSLSSYSTENTSANYDWRGQCIIDNTFAVYNTTSYRAKFAFDNTWWNSNQIKINGTNYGFANRNANGIQFVVTTASNLTTVEIILTGLPYLGTEQNESSVYNIEVVLTRRTYSDVDTYKLVYLQANRTSADNTSSSTNLSGTKFDEFTVTGTNYATITKRTYKKQGTSYNEITSKTTTTNVYPFGYSSSANFSYYSLNASITHQAYEGSAIEIKFIPKTIKFEINYYYGSTKIANSNSFEFNGSAPLVHNNLDYYKFVNWQNGNVNGNESFYEMVGKLIGGSAFGTAIYSLTPNINAYFTPSLYTYVFYTNSNKTSELFRINNVNYVDSTHQIPSGNNDKNFTVQGYLNADNATRAKSYISSDALYYSYLQCYYGFGLRADHSTNVKIGEYTIRYDSTDNKFIDIIANYKYEDATVYLYLIANSGVEQSIALSVYYGEVESENKKLGEVSVKYSELASVSWNEKFFDQSNTTLKNNLLSVYNGDGKYSSNKEIIELFYTKYNTEDVKLSEFIEDKYIPGTAPASEQYNSKVWNPTEKIKLVVFTKTRQDQLNIYFNNTYITDSSFNGNDKNTYYTLEANGYKTVVLYKQTEHTAPEIPLPERSAYTFGYWKAVGAKKDYYIYDKGAYDGTAQDLGNTEIIENNLIFYAYWLVVEPELEVLTSTEFTYNSENHVVELGFKDGTVPQDMKGSFNALVGVVKQSITEYVQEGVTDAQAMAGVYVDANTGKTSLTLKYTAHSGNYIVKLTYAFPTGSGPESANYILNASSFVDRTFDAVKIVVNQKQLNFMQNVNGTPEIVATVEKVYDISKTVLTQYIGEICAVDSGVYKTKLEYATQDIGENIPINISVTCTDLLVKGSYKLPQNVNVGVITPYLIKVFSNNAKAYYTNNKIEIINADILPNGTLITNTVRSGISHNLEDVAKFLSSRIVNATGGNLLDFSIQTNSASAGKYSQPLGNLVVTHVIYDKDGRDISGNFKVLFLDFNNQSDYGVFEIININGDEELYEFVVVRDPYGSDTTTPDISKIVNYITITDTNRSDFVYYEELTKLVIQVVRKYNNNNSFKIDINFANCNWWTNKVKFINYENGVNEFINLATSYFVDTNGATVTAEIPSHTIQATLIRAEIIITNHSEITYELGLLDGEGSIDGNPTKQKVKYNTSYTPPTANRYDLSLIRWFYVYNGEQTTVELNKQISWLIKDDITLFAVWEFNVEIDVAGQDVDSIYDPSVTYVYTANQTIKSGGNHAQNEYTNAFLNANIAQGWEKCATADGTYSAVETTSGIKQLSITLQDVLHSGYYKYSFVLNNIIKYLDNDEYLSIETNFTFNFSNKGTTKVNKQYYYIVEVAPKEVTLVDYFSKQFDGITTNTYVIEEKHIGTIYTNSASQELARQYLVGKEVEVVYSNVWVGSTISKITIENSVTNYKIVGASGTIYKREISIDIGENVFIYNEGTFTVASDKISIDVRIHLTDITFTTTLADIGTYVYGETAEDLTDVNNGLILSFNASYENDIKISDPITQFEFFVDGFIKIDPAELGSIYDIYIGFADATNYVTDTSIYNTDVQEVLAYLKHKKSGVVTQVTSGYSYSSKGNTLGYLDIENADSYTVNATIVKHNFIDYEQELTLIIKALVVKVDIIETSKVYDGTVYLKELKDGIGYNLYYGDETITDYITKGTIIDSKYKDELIGVDHSIPSQKFWFEYDDENVAEAINLALIKDTTNFALDFNNYNLSLIAEETGSITLRNLYITFLEGFSKYYDELQFKVDFDNLTEENKNLVTVENLVTVGGVTEKLHGTILFTKMKDANIYKISASTQYTLGLQIDDTETGINNYKVILDGTLIIHKAVLTITLTQEEYEYNGTTQTILYTVVRNSDNKVVVENNNTDSTQIVYISKNEGVNARAEQYEVYFTISSTGKDYTANYTFTDRSEDNVDIKLIKINKKTVDLTFVDGDLPSNTKLYDGTIFEYTLADNARFNSQLVAGHLFNSNSHVSKLVTPTSYVGIYKIVDGLNVNNIKIFTSAYEEVTENYNIITENTALKIVSGAISKFTIGNYVYDGTIQDIEFTLYILKSGTSEYTEISVKISGEKQQGIDTPKTTTVELNDEHGTTTEISLELSRKNSETSFEIDDFKYAGEYKIKVHSDIFADYSFPVKISQLEIKNITVENASKEYDRTTDFFGNIASTDLVINDNNTTATDDDFSDSNHIKFKGVYATNFNGDNDIIINISFDNVRGTLEETEFNKLQNSYILALEQDQKGQITRRNVTFEYIGTTPFYYDGEAKFIEVNTINFNIVNALDLEPFGGMLTFANIVNAKENYSLEESKDVGTFDELYFEYGNSSKERYNITLSGTLTVNKAELCVLSVSNNQHVYDGAQKGVVLKASIYGGNGKIPEDMKAEDLISANYKLIETSEIVTPINAGVYNVYPIIKTEYANNYKLVADANSEYKTEGECLDSKLTILKRDTTISATEAKYASVGKTEFKFTTYLSEAGIELLINNSNVVAGQVVSGSIKIGEGVGTYYYIKKADLEDITDGVTVNNVAILSGEEDVTANYNIYFDITIIIDQDPVEGQVSFRIIDTAFTYDSKEFIGRIEVRFETKLSDGNIDYKIAKNVGDENTYGKLLGFYNNEADAHIANADSALSSIISAGEYWASVKRINLATQEYDEAIYIVKFTIYKKTITLASLTLNGEPFDGTKVYDALTQNTLESSDICKDASNALDDVQIIATFENGLVGTQKVAISTTGSDKDNYTLEVLEIDGYIKQATVKITNYDGSHNKSYIGKETITILVNNLAYEGLLSGSTHELRGYIEISVANAQKYSLANNSTGTTYLKVFDGAEESASDITSNYAIEIDETLMLEISKANITIELNGWKSSEDSIYSAQSKLSLLRSEFKYNFPDGFKNDAKTEAIEATLVLFNYTNNIGSAVQEVTDIKEAGDYAISISSGTSNITFNYAGIKTITVVKKQAQVNLGQKELKYVEYNSDTNNNATGYGISFSGMVTGGLEQDKHLFEQGSYKISVEYRAQQTYLYEDGKVSIEWINEIINNYEFTSVVGGFILTDEGIAVDTISALTYNAQNRLPGLIKLGGVDITDPSIGGNIIGVYSTSANAENNTDRTEEIRNAGEYVVKIEINAAYYYVKVTVNKKAIESFSNIVLNKEYDGNENVLNSDGTTDLQSNDVQANESGVKDSITFVAKYLATESYEAWFVGTHNIFVVATADDVTLSNYILPTNLVGEITTRALTVDLGDFELTFNKQNKYEYSYSSIIVVGGDTVVSNIVSFELQNNNVIYDGNVPQARFISTTTNENATVSYSQLKIEHSSGVDSTGCYAITINGNVTIKPIGFNVVFVGFVDDTTVYNASNKQVELNVETIEGFDISEDELSTIRLNTSQTYQKQTGTNEFSNVGQAVDVGTYKVIPEYKGEANYIVNGIYVNYGDSNNTILADGVYMFTITPFEYNVTIEGADIKTFNKQYGISDSVAYPDGLKQEFTKNFEGGGSCAFVVTYTRETGEAIGEYNLTVNSVSTNNISFVATTALENKFVIGKNTTSTILIEIFGGEGLIRYYGLDNIEQIDILTLQYNVYQDGTLLDVNSEYNAGITAGTISYGINGQTVPNVGLYSVASGNITSTNFTNFTFTNTIDENSSITNTDVIDGQLKILPRTLVITADSYDKVYDGTTEFIGEATSYNFESVEAEGKLSDERKNYLIEQLLVFIAYENANVGEHNLICSVSGSENYKPTTAQSTGNITVLNVKVNVENQEIDYGNNVPYSYTVEYAEEIPNNKFSAEQLSQFVELSINATLEDYSTTGYLKARSQAYSYVANITDANKSNVAISNDITSILTVNKKEITVQFEKEIEKEYDGTVTINIDFNSNKYTITGICSNGSLTDYVDVSYIEFANAYPGKNKEVIIILTGADSENYVAKNIFGNVLTTFIIFKLNYYYENCNEHITGLDDLVDGTYTATEVEFAYNHPIATSEKSLPTPQFKNNGVKCIGWSLAPNGELIDLNENVSSYINPYPDDKCAELYAIWETQSFEVTIEVYKLNPNSMSYENVRQPDEPITNIQFANYKAELDAGKFVQDYVLNNNDIDVEHFVLYGYGINNTNNAISIDTKIVVEDQNLVINLLYNPELLTLAFDANSGAFTNQDENVFMYAGNGVAQTQIYYSQEIGKAIENIQTLLTIARVGYKNPVWTLNNVEYSIDEIKAYAVTTETTFVADWTAETYKLILDANGGEFESSSYSDKWHQETIGDKTRIFTTVTYDQAILNPLPMATKFAYNFDKYVEEDGTNWTNNEGTIILESGKVLSTNGEIVWKHTGDIVLKAEYADKTWTLIITTTNSDASIKTTDGNGNVITLNDEDGSADNNAYVYTVKTSYNVIITASANEGYENPWFKDENNLGTTFENTYTITLFTNNATIEVFANPRVNTITIKANNNTMGYVTSNFEGVEYSSNGENFEIKAKTGTEVIVTATSNVGYMFNDWYIVGTGTIDKVSNFATLKGFIGDVEIIAEFKPIDLYITVINDPECGAFNYLGYSYNEEQNELPAVKTGEAVVLTINANHGYELDKDNIVFVIEDGTDKTNEFVTQEYNSEKNQYIVTISGFTTNGTLTLAYKLKEFTITFGYAEAEFNNLTQQYVINVEESSGSIVFANSANHNAGATLTAQYKTEISVQSIYEKVGYKFYKFMYLSIDGDYVDMVGTLNSTTNTITFELVNNYQLYVVYERITYTVTYKVNNTAHGTIGYYTQDESAYVGKTEIMETVKYGLNTSAINAKPIDTYREVVGWKVEGTDEYVSTNAILEAQTILIKDGYWVIGSLQSTLPAENSIILVAEFKGTEETLNVYIYGKNGRDISADIADLNEVIVGTGFTKSEATYNSEENKIIVPLTYTVGTEVNFELNVPQFYQMLEGSVRVDIPEFNLGLITPETLTTYEIKLTLKYYKVELVVEEGFTNAVTFETTSDGQIGLGPNSNFNANGTTLVSAEVEYGGKLVLTMSVASGFTYIPTASTTPYVNGNIVTISNVEKDLNIMFEFVGRTYKVIFNTNYPTDYPIGDQTFNSSTTNLELSFVIEHGKSELKAEYGDEINDLFTAQDYTQSKAYENNPNIIFKFDGWSVTNSIEAAAPRKYYFESVGGNYINKLYYFNNTDRVNAFDYAIIEKDAQGNELLDENNNVIVHLYATWTVPVYEVSVSFVPEKVNVDASTLSFTRTLGVLEAESQDHLLRAAYGAEITVYGIPSLENYKLYGWNFSGASEINEFDSSNTINFNMPQEDVAIVVYYQVKVTVLVEEPTQSVNKVTLNGEEVTNGKLEIWSLINTSVTLTAEAGKGFNWAYWLQDGIQNDELNQNCSVEILDATILTAVFVGKTVKLVLDGTNTHVDLKLYLYGDTLKNQISEARVGDKIIIAIGNIEFGFNFHGISVNDSTSKVTQNTSGSEYYYTVAVEDAEKPAGENVLVIKALVSVKDVVIEFVSNEPDAFNVTVNDKDYTTSKIATFKYNQMVTIKLETKIRYEMTKMLFNGTEVEYNDGFVLHLFDNGSSQYTIKTGTDHNKVELTFNKQYWLNDKAKFGGDGSEESPYIIGDAYTLAYMAYQINEGQIDQSLGRKYYKITSNIDLTEKFWVPIGTEENPFAGTFILGDYKITGVFHDQTYDVLSWSEYCEGVFGHVSPDAQIVLKQSNAPTFILIGAVALFIIVVVVVTVIIVSKRKKKVKRFSENLGVSNMQSTNGLDDDEMVSEAVVDDISLNVDNEVKEILKQQSNNIKQKPNNMPQKPAPKPQTLESVSMPAKPSVEQKPKVAPKPSMPPKPSMQTKPNMPQKPEATQKPKLPPTAGNTAKPNIPTKPNASVPKVPKKLN